MRKFDPNLDPELLRLVERATAQITVPPQSAPRVRPFAFRRALGGVVILVVAVAGALGVGRVLTESRNRVAAQPIAFDIRPVPPARTSGTGRATLNSQGDLVLEVSVRGPADEISRPVADVQTSNLIWHLLEGSCAAWQGNEPGHQVLARWTLPPQRPDAMDFRYVISSADLAAQIMSRPHAVAAFRNGGGGPLYTCGDLPAL